MSVLSLDAGELSIVAGDTREGKRRKELSRNESKVRRDCSLKAGTSSAESNELSPWHLVSLEPGRDLARCLSLLVTVAKYREFLDLLSSAERLSSGGRGDNTQA